MIDAGSHTLEPPQIWTTWLPKKFHDRAPQLVKHADGGDWPDSRKVVNEARVGVPQEERQLILAGNRVRIDTLPQALEE